MWFYASSGWDSDVCFAIWRRFMMLMTKLKVFHLFLLVLESHSSALLMGAFTWESKNSNKSDSDFNLVYSFDQKSWQVPGGVKNRLACQAVRGGTFGIVIIELEFEVQTQRNWSSEKSCNSAPSKYIKRHQRGSVFSCDFPFTVNWTLVKLMMIYLTSHLECSVTTGENKITLIFSKVSLLCKMYLGSLLSSLENLKKFKSTSKGLFFPFSSYFCIFR